MKKRIQSSDIESGRVDPFPYDGPLRRVDGVAPYNHYLWPLDRDWYWARKDLDDRISSRWHFSAIALADGRWLSSGHIRDESRMQFFETREAALRHSAAEFLRTIRGARHWDRYRFGSDYVSPELYVRLVAWVTAVLKRKPLRLTVKPAPPKPPVWSDLPLFAEYGNR